jgi:valyl-tRNA synthetase
MHLLEQYSADALRYWAASGRPGTDTVFDEGQMKVGRRLAIKILNASKFALGLGGETSADAPITEPLDQALLLHLADLVDECTRAFDGYDYARVLERAEAFFWGFCDDYLELVKTRAYGERGTDAAASAQATLQLALATLLKLFAPFLPFVTDEVWSWWHDGSIHRSSWPDAAAVRARAADEANPNVYPAAAATLAEIRRAKTEAKRSLRAEVERIVVVDTAARIADFEPARLDVMEAGRVSVADTREVVGDEPAVVEVTLAPDEA